MDEGSVPKGLAPLFKSKFNAIKNEIKVGKMITLQHN